MKNETKIDVSTLCKSIQNDLRNDKNQINYNSSDLNLVKYRKKSNFKFSVKKSLCNNQSKESDSVFPLLTVDCHRIVDAKKLNNEFKKIIINDVNKVNSSDVIHKTVENKVKFDEDKHIRNVLHVVNLSLEVQKEKFISENLKILRRLMINVHETIQNKCKTNIDFIYNHDEVKKDLQLPRLYERKEDREQFFSTSIKSERPKSIKYLEKFKCVDHFLENILTKIKRRAIFLSEKNIPIKEDEIVNLLNKEVNLIKEKLKVYLKSEDITKNLTKNEKKMLSINVVNLFDTFIAQNNTSLFTNKEILKYTQVSSYQLSSNQSSEDEGYKNNFNPSIVKIIRKNKLKGIEYLQNQIEEKYKSRNREFLDKQIINSELNEYTDENDDDFKEEGEIKNDKKILTKKINSKLSSHAEKEFQLRNKANHNIKYLLETNGSESIEDHLTYDKNSTIDASYSRINNKNEETLKETEQKLSKKESENENHKKTTLQDNFTTTKLTSESNSTNKFIEYNILFNQNKDGNSLEENKKNNNSERFKNQILKDKKRKRTRIKDRKTFIFEEEDEEILFGDEKKTRRRKSDIIDREQIYDNLNVILNNVLEDFINENENPSVKRLNSSKAAKKSYLKDIVLSRREIAEQSKNNEEKDIKKEIIKPLEIVEKIIKKEEPKRSDVNIKDVEKTKNISEVVKNKPQINHKNKLEIKKESLNHNNKNIKVNKSVIKPTTNNNQKTVEKKNTSEKKNLKKVEEKKGNTKLLPKLLLDENVKKIEKQKSKNTEETVIKVAKKKEGDTKSIYNNTIKKKSEKELKSVIKENEIIQDKIELLNKTNHKENKDINIENVDQINSPEEENKFVKEDIEESEEEDDEDESENEFEEKDIYDMQYYKKLNKENLTNKKKNMLKRLKTKIFESPEYLNDEEIENYIINDENDEKDDAKMILKKLDLKNRIVTNKLRRNSKGIIELPNINPKGFYYNNSIKRSNNKKKSSNDSQDEAFYRNDYKKNYNNSYDSKGKFMNGISPFINKSTFLNDEK
jgi:hypothetical protein